MGIWTALPMVDIESVTAGGGSSAGWIRWVSFASGQWSAGARPGPACYGRAAATTVTDALVVLGTSDAAASSR